MLRASAFRNASHYRLRRSLKFEGKPRPSGWPGAPPRQTCCATRQGAPFGLARFARQRASQRLARDSESTSHCAVAIQRLKLPGGYGRSKTGYLGRDQLAACRFRWLVAPRPARSELRAGLAHGTIGTFGLTRYRYACLWRGDNTVRLPKAGVRPPSQGEPAPP